VALPFILKIIGSILAVLVLVTAVVLLLAPRSPRPPGAVKSVSQLEAYLTALTESGMPPGVSLAVIKDGHLVYSQGFGWADGPKGQRASAGTVYHWWSMTKIPTAIAILQLQERGVLSIDDPVSKYLPFFQVTYPDSRQILITLRHLLNHSSGLKDNVPEIIGWVHWEGDPPYNQTELLKAKFPAYSQLIFTPGERTQYTNIGYMVLGAVIEAVSGQSYEAYVAENIFLPLKMDCTGFVVTSQMAEQEAAGTQHIINLFTPLLFPLMDIKALVRERDGMRLWFNRIYNDQTPPTGLIGPVSDAARLVQSIQNGGVLDGQQILSAESAASLTAESQLPMKGGGKQGLGWKFYHDPAGRLYMGHAGGGVGFATEMRLYPAEGMGLVLMGNDTTFPQERILDLAASLDW
jgi:D-alanyl-D-alanine carboxypeptidase